MLGWGEQADANEDEMNHRPEMREGLRSKSCVRCGGIRTEFMNVWAVCRKHVAQTIGKMIEVGKDGPMVA